MDNSMEAFVEGARRVWKIAIRRRWLALGVSAIAAAASVAVLQKVPDRYQASARIYVDTQTVLKPLMTGLTFQPDIDQQVAMLARTLISRANVEALLNQPELRLSNASTGEREAAVTKLMERIKVAPTTTLNLFEISYRGPEPADAQRLVQATVDLFMRTGTGAKKRDSAEAGRFIEDQIKSSESRLVEAESRLKEFKVRNFGVSGVSNQDYFMRISTLGEEVSKLRVELSAAEQARNTYRRELNTEDPQLPPDALVRAGGGAPVENDMRLDEQRRRLDELLLRYTDAHPDVVSTRRSIAELDAERRARLDAAARASGTGRKAATSPIYQKLRVSLAENEVLVASLRSQLSTQQARLEQVRALAGRLPQVEAELAQLNRDYDVMRKNYDVLVARRESAALGERLDASSQLADFRVIEPASVAARPVFPARLHLAALAVLASLAAGVGATLLLDLLRPTFIDASSLRLFSGRPVLGTVSAFAGANAASRTAFGRVEQSLFGAALGLLIALQVAWVAWMAFKNTLH
jgi:polysaccharide chain length determinant protein (PEP-CTERM system associated)